MLQFSLTSATAKHRRGLPALWAGYITVLVWLAGTVAPPAIAQEKSPRTLTVTGQGVERIQTTIARVRLGVDVDGTTAQQVQQEVAQRSDTLVSLLKSRNVAQLETTGISLNPNYRYVNNQRQLTGYRGNNIVTFQLAIERVGSLLDEAVAAGATRIDNVSFTAAEVAIAEAQKSALQSATLDAQSQANAVLSALNFSPQEIVSIQVNGAQAPQPLVAEQLQLRAGATSASPSSPVIGGDQNVRASVTLQIRY